MVCKHCEQQRLKKATDVKALILEQILLEPETVSSSIHQQRLKICANCEFLIEDTCSKCGCYVEFRTAIPHKSCPLHYWN